MKLNIDNTTSRVFSINAIFTEDYRNDKVAEILKQYCAKKYGRKKEFVDAEIAARLGMLNDEPIPQVEQPSPEGQPSPEPLAAPQATITESASIANGSATETSVQQPASTTPQQPASTTPQQPVSTVLMGDHPQPTAQPVEGTVAVVSPTSPSESNTTR